MHTANEKSDIHYIRYMGKGIIANGEREVKGDNATHSTWVF